MENCPICSSKIKTGFFAGANRVDENKLKLINLVNKGLIVF